MVFSARPLTPGPSPERGEGSLAVCHCFAEAVPSATRLHCLPYGKQWHTAMNNLGWAPSPQIPSRQGEGS